MRAWSPTAVSVPVKRLGSLASILALTWACTRPADPFVAYELIDRYVATGTVSRVEHGHVEPVGSFETTYQRSQTFEFKFLGTHSPKYKVSLRAQCVANSWRASTDITIGAATERFHDESLSIAIARIAGATSVARLEADLLVRPNSPSATLKLRQGGEVKSKVAGRTVYEKGPSRYEFQNGILRRYEFNGLIVVWTSVDTTWVDSPPVAGSQAR